MSLYLDKNKAQLTLSTSTDLNVSFLSVPKNFFISENNETYYLFVRQNISAYCYYNNECLSIDFERNNNFVSLLTIEISYDSIETEVDKIYITKDNIDFLITFENIKYDIDDDGKILLSLLDYHSSIKITENLKMFAAQNSFVALVDSSFTISSSTYVPEFSISAFDDANYTIARPIRQGQQIISTVPALINTNSTDEEISYYQNGLGPDKKTIYLKIICNSILESTLTAGQVSPNLTLKVYYPNGLDTVKAPVYKSMYFLSKDVTNNISIYTATADFYTYGIHNNIEYVDGYMYFDVQMPLTVQDSLPISFDFTLS